MDLWAEIIIKPFINVLLVINSVFGNFGIAIILFTLLIRAVTHPLMVQQIKGAAKMQDMQKDPRYKELQVKYKNDKEKLQTEQAKLIQEMGVNPLASCLPLLIQFPIIIGLYQSLIQTMVSTPLELLNLSRNVYPWLHTVASVVPINSQFLWMNLSQPDTSLRLGPIPLPIMAILVLITSWVQSRVMQPPADPGNQQAGMMTGVMNIYMPLIMGYMGFTLASGLAIYFLASNVVGIGQYALLGRVNWKAMNPFYKPPVVVDAKGSKKAASQEPAMLETSRKPAAVEAGQGIGSGKTSGLSSGNSKHPIKPKKANITKPVKGSSTKPK